MALIQTSTSCKIVIFITLAKISLSNASNNSSVHVTWSKFHSFSSADSINTSIVTKTYPETVLRIHCASKCIHDAAESFYHLNASSKCYCNNQPDDNIVEDEAGTMVYGYPVQPATAVECQQMYDNGSRTDGDFTTSSGREMLCDFTSLGWVVFARRVDGSEAFQRTWDAYVAGFGDTTGEFWLGLEELHRLTQAGCELHVYLEAEPGHPVQAKGYARYSNFSVGAALTNYALYVDGFSGNVGDSLILSSGCPFSTYDADHDFWPSGSLVLVTVLCLITTADVINAVTLTVTVYTSSTEWYAGTDASVYINLYGKNGATGTKQLDNSEDNFNSGDIDRFTLYVSDIGTPTKLRIWTDNSGPGAGWYLDKVVIGISGKGYTFNYHGWIEEYAHTLYPTKCGSPPTAPRHGTWITEPSPYIVHQTAVLKCNPGYLRSTSSNMLATIVCQSTGYWSSTRATCYIIPPVNGGWGTWQAWSACSLTCDNGVKQRQRVCNNPRPQHGGAYCHGNATESNQCHLVDCPNWSAWFFSPCSATCGAGTKQGVRVCSSGHVEDCAGSSTTTAACNITPCPVDGGWGSWAVWGSCSLTCGNGTRSRGRVCDSPAPAYRGSGCHGNSTEDGVCNSQDCPHWGPYSKTGVCSVTCGQGVEQLTRNCSTGNTKDCTGSRYDESPCTKPACATIVVG